MNESEDRMKETRERYGVTREELDKLGMDEFDYENMEELSIKNFIKGHLADICKIDGSVDLEQIAENIYDIAKIHTDQESLQKMIFGEMVGSQKENVHRPQLVSVSMKLSKKLLEAV